jgi:hypothetical protein
MNELISEFINNYFTDEVIEDLRQAYDLFEVFSNQDHEEKIIDALTNSNISTTDQKDAVLKAVHDVADSILDAHTIKTYDDVCLSVKNKILTALFLIQHLEDSKPFLIALESQDNEEEILAFIISELTNIEPCDVMLSIADFRPSLLVNLKKYLESMQVDTEQTDSVDKYVSILKELKDYTKQNDLIGLKLTESGMLLGQRLFTYASFISDIPVNNIDSLALQILSLIFMTAEGLNNPIVTYQRNSHLFFDDAMMMGKVENSISSQLANFNEYRKALHEKNRLLETSIQ